MPTYYSGIDLHKRTSYFTTVDEDGTVVKEANLKNYPSIISAYFASLPGSHKAVVESTFNWYWLADLLNDQNISLELAHAKYLKAITYAKVKTDKVDARTMAQLLRIDMIPQAHQISYGLLAMCSAPDCAWFSAELGFSKALQTKQRRQQISQNCLQPCRHKSYSIL